MFPVLRKRQGRLWLVDSCELWLTRSDSAIVPQPFAETSLRLYVADVSFVVSTSQETLNAHACCKHVILLMLRCYRGSDVGLLSSAIRSTSDPAVCKSSQGPGDESFPTNMLLIFGDWV